MNILLRKNKLSVISGSLLLFTLVVTVLVISCGPGGTAGRNLEAAFIDPPESSKPRVWWHWMNGNITREGIKADLEWMKRAGIGGFQNFDAALSTPQVVEKRIIYMTPDWKDAFRYTARLADSLNLEMTIAGSPGWSESGGPWVTPAQAMKKFVWSETFIKGGDHFTGALPKPPSATGTFQNIPRESENGITDPEYYADAAVVAFKVPDNEVPESKLKPVISSSNGRFDLTDLTDGDLVKASFLQATPLSGKSWIQFKFEKPETIQSASIVVASVSDNNTSGVLEAGDDGVRFNTIMEIPRDGAAEKTLTFKPVTAKFFRLAFTTPLPPDGVSKSKTESAQSGVRISEFVLYRSPRINRFEDKAGFSSISDLYSLATPTVDPANVINNKDVIDLTSEMQPDGRLDWTPPAGNWIVLRLGYSLTGKKNHPASPEATGFEVDKLSAEHCKAYFTNYLAQYKDATAGLMGKRGLKYIVTDSWEAGTLNWTDKMIQEFKNRRGYDLIPWIPALTGHIVESAEASDRFLWDFRKTIADLTAENHYDQLTTLLHARNMGRYTESHEGGRALVADGMEVKRSADIPMSATWTPQIPGSSNISNVHKSDVRESASVSHIYGQNLVAAESMTAYGTPWQWAPELLKPTADMELASGLNRFVIHCSTHQPVNDKIPGLGLGPFGQWFTRNETWAEQAIAWTTYLSRSSYMLQQGKFVADIAYYYGEDNNITALFESNLPDIPEGYNFDFVNADALKTVFSVENGQLVTKGGMTYPLLVLDRNSMQMSLPVLRKISELVRSGAVILGPKPVTTPSLSDDKAEFEKIADELWTKDKGVTIVGNGKIYTGMTLAEVLAENKITPDFLYTKPQQNTEILYVHRKVNNIDIYWINNRNRRVEEIDATFRIAGKAPEIWHPETGLIEQASYKIAGNETTVPLKLEPNDALFIVFRKKVSKQSLDLAKTVETQLAEVSGPWDVSFQAGRGAPASVVLDKLSSWSESNDPGIKYFSGTGTYTKKIVAAKEWFNEGQQLWLDLGSVKNLAEVVVNGESVGITWKIPFRVNVTEVLKPGENEIAIKVTDLWVNRLIGDMQPDMKTKITYTTQPFYQADSPLVPSGLLGPVVLMKVSEN